MDGATANARRKYHHVHNGGKLTESDVAGMVRAMEDKDDTIARLTAELTESREKEALERRKVQALLAELEAEKARRGAIIEMAAGLVDRRRSVIEVGTELSGKIRALDPDATAALAELLDAETRACAEVVRSAIPNIAPDGPTNDECRIVYEELGGAMTAILARLDQRKEEGE